MHVGVDEFEDSNLIVACNVASLFSIVGCIIIILMFLRFRRLRKHFSRLVVYLTISDFWFCCANILGHFPDNGSGCFVQALLATYFGLASILWTGAIAYSLKRVIENCAGFNEAVLEPRMLQVCWGVPFLLTVATLIVVRFEPAGFWCWIDSTAMGEIARLITFYIPLWSCICYCTYTYRRLQTRMSYLLNSTDINAHRFSIIDPESTHQDETRALNRLMMFPMVLCFCWTAGSINRIVGIFFPTFSWSLLNYITVTTGSLQGFLNACLYGSTIAVREALVDCLADGVSFLQRGVVTWKARKRRRWERLGYVKTKKYDADSAVHGVSPAVFGKNENESQAGSVDSKLISYEIDLNSPTHGAQPPVRTSEVFL